MKGLQEGRLPHCVKDVKTNHVTHPNEEGKKLSEEEKNLKDEEIELKIMKEELVLMLDI